MRRKINFCVGCLPALVTGLLFFDVQCRADGFAYNDFSAPSSLIFQGDATLVQERLRLTPAERGKAGGVWFSTKQRVKDGFETSFQFQLTKPGGSGANGIAFVIQNNETPLLGLAGHGWASEGSRIPWWSSLIRIPHHTVAG
jgi:hypothetical protein